MKKKLYMQKEVHVTMLKNKTKKILTISALSLAGVFALTACNDDIMAKPSNYNDPVITEKQTDEPLDVYGNLLDTVYDGLRKGSVATDTLDKVLYQYAISIIGRYNKLCDKGTLADGEVTLKLAYKDAISDGPHTIAKQFIEDHPAYWSTTDREKAATDTDIQIEELERLKTRFETIEDRLAAALYDKIKGGTYSERNYFNEVDFYTNVKCADLGKVNTNIGSGTVFFDHVYFDPNIEPEECFSFYLHRDLYQYNWNVRDEQHCDETGSDITYFEDNFIPAIYRQLLVEQYIREEATSSIGRSLARKVNIIALNNNAKYDKAAPELMNYFLNNKVISEPKNVLGLPTDSLEETANIVTLADFKTFNDVWKGNADNLRAKTILEDLSSKHLGVFEKKSDVSIEGQAIEYFTATDLDTNVITPYKESVKKGDYSKFTGNGAHSTMIGIEMEAINTMLADYVTNGWFTRNSDSSVVSKFSDTLFNVSVAKDLYLTKYNPLTEEQEFTDENDRFYYEDGSWKLSRSRDNSQYIARIKNAFFLKNTEHEQLADDDCSDIIWYSGGTYYIVQVEYAVSSNKLNRTSSIAYDADTREDVINEVLKVLGKSESYSNLSKKHWLEKMKIEYHDTVVYDYFKANFPELFD